MCVRRLVSQIFSPLDSTDEYDTESRSRNDESLSRELWWRPGCQGYKFLRRLLIKNCRVISQNADLNWIMCCWQRQSSSYFMVESRVWVRKRARANGGQWGGEANIDIFMLICDSLVLGVKSEQRRNNFIVFWLEFIVKRGIFIFSTFLRYCVINGIEIASNAKLATSRRWDDAKKWKFVLATI